MSTSDSINTQVTRVIELDPVDWYLATWRNLPPLPRPEPKPFDQDACCARVGSIKLSRAGWCWAWKSLEMPVSMTREEAVFWLTAMTAPGRDMKPKALAEFLARQDYDREPSLEEIRTQLRVNGRSLSGGVVAPLSHFFFPEELVQVLHSDLLVRDDDRTFHREPQLSLDLLDGFCRYVLPYLSVEEMEAVRNGVRAMIEALPSLHQTVPPSPLRFWIAACLGMQNVVAAAPTTGSTGVFDSILMFGVRDRSQVESTFRQRKLWTPRCIRAWLAHTEFSGLDLIRDSILKMRSRQVAEDCLRVFCKVKAPEAAPHLLELRMKCKTPILARRWLDEQVGNGVAGLLPVAAGRGKLAEAALEYLRDVKHRGHGLVIEEQLKLADPKWADRLRRAVLAEQFSCVAVLETKSCPELNAALAGMSAQAARLPRWVRTTCLPPLLIDGKALDDAAVLAVLLALRRSTLQAPHAFVPVLVRHAEPESRDAFALRLFELWRMEGMPSKEKWPLFAAGLLGGNRCAFQLGAHLPVWQRKRHYKRVELGLECLRTIGSGLALMQLGKLIHSGSYGLRNRARIVVSEVAAQRGLSLEQLEDRIVPDLGFDERGEKALDYGSRRFRIVLVPDFRPMVRHASGKVRDALPRPTVKDDALKVDLARKDWKLLRAQLRETLGIQIGRLEAAMVQARRWHPDEFRDLIVRHPLLKHLARLLLWGCYGPFGTLTLAFRITAEEDHAGIGDEQFKLYEHDQIGLVHPIHLKDEERLTWGEQFADYHLVQPFPQLGRQVFRVQTGEEQAKSLTRYKDLTIDPRPVHRMMRKQGWLQVYAEPNGFFKAFPGGDVTAFIQTEGHGTMRLKEVWFVAGEATERFYLLDRMSLGDVDSVAFSETVATLEFLVSKTIP